MIAAPAPALDPSAARAATVQLYAAARPAVAMAGMGSAGLVDFVGECQAGIRALEAAQTLAVARLAATEEVITQKEAGQGLGYRRLDAPDLVSGGVGAVRAAGRADRARGGTGRRKGRVFAGSRAPGIRDRTAAGTGG